MARLTRLALGIAMLGCGISTSPAHACSVPVFRYALERWTADPYEAEVHYRDQLSEADQRLIKMLEQGGDEPGTPNLVVRSREITQDDEQESDTDFPRLILRYPRKTGLPGEVIRGALTEENVRRIVSSPVRRELVERLREGATAVWVLLESGDAERDNQAYDVLRSSLTELETLLKLPDIDQADVEQGLISIAPDQLELSFDLLRLKRDDPREHVLREMLLGTESDLREFDGPLAFPVFGRGRVLYALVDIGIQRETIEEACRTLIGPCTCQVKDENPGTDLLITAAWDVLSLPDLYQEIELPALPGLGGLAEDEPHISTSSHVETPDVSETLVETNASVSTLADNSASEATTEEETALQPGQGFASPVVVNTLIVGVLLGLGVVVAARWLPQ